jgi:hypothetical protein
VTKEIADLFDRPDRLIVFLNAEPTRPTQNQDSLISVENSLIG